MPIAETTVKIELDKPYTLYFNANCMCAFEEATGKNFLETVAKLYDAYKPMLDAAKRGEEPSTTAAYSQLIKLVPISDLTALIWAGIHTYDSDDNPHWPLTIGQVRRMITLPMIPKLFLSFLQGQSKNSPTAAEMGESQALPDSPARNGTSGAQKPSNGDGGERSIELPEGAFS